MSSDLVVGNINKWRSCKPYGSPTDFNLVIAAVWINPTTGQLMCATVSTMGTAQVYHFTDLTFEVVL